AGISWPKLAAAPEHEAVWTTAPLVVDLGADGAVKVPSGFWSDGASVPKWAWPMLDAGPLRLLVMGIAHDYAVRIGAVIQRPGRAEPFTVDLATELAVEVARYHGADARDRWKIGAALSATAWTYWQRKPLDWRPAG